MTRYKKLSNNLTKDNAKNNNIYNLRYNAKFFFYLSIIGISGFGLIKLDQYLSKEKRGQYEDASRSTNEPKTKYSLKLLEAEEEIEQIAEKEYSGMQLDHDYEDYLYEQCLSYADEYNYDVDELFKIVLTIGEQESDGKWDCDGKVSPTNDYGQFQLNVCNHRSIFKQFGYTSSDLQYDEYKNGEAAIWLVCENILTNNHCDSIEDVFGMYNGWINWRQKEQSVKYTNSCLKIMENYFSEEEELNINYQENNTKTKMIHMDV